MADGRIIPAPSLAPAGVAGSGGPSGLAGRVRIPPRSLRPDAPRGAVWAATLAAFGGLALGVLHVAVGEGAPAEAVLIVLAVIALALLAVSPSLSFLYQCIALPVVITLNRHAGPWGPGRLTTYFFILVSLVAAAIALGRFRPRPVHLRAAGLALLVFVVYLGGHVLGADDPWAAFEGFVNHTYHWAFLLLPIALLRERWQIRMIFLMIAAMGTLIALASLAVALISSNPSELLAHGGRFQRVHLYFGTANSLGMFLSIVFFVLLHAVPTRSRWLSLARLAAQFVVLAAILLTFSRRAWLATGLLLLVHFARQRDWRALALVVLVGVALSYQTLTFEQVAERAESMLDPTDAANAGREQEYVERLRDVAAGGVSWTGRGLEDAAYAAEAGGRGPLYFHNYYVSLYYVTGVFGAGLYLALAGAILLGLRRARRLARAPDTARVVSAGSAVLLIVLITGLFGMGNVTFPVNFYSALVPGLAFALVAREREEHAVAGAPTR
jgi:hypothetical protein